MHYLNKKKKKQKKTKKKTMKWQRNEKLYSV